MSVKVSWSAWFPIDFLSLRLILVFVFILNERICKGWRDNDDLVSRLEEPKTFTSPSIWTQECLSLKGCPLAKDYFISLNSRLRLSSGITQFFKLNWGISRTPFSARFKILRTYSSWFNKKMVYFKNLDFSLRIPLAEVFLLLFE